MTESPPLRVRVRAAPRPQVAASPLSYAAKPDAKIEVVYVDIDAVQASEHKLTKRSVKTIEDMAAAMRDLDLQMLVVFQREPLRVVYGHDAVAAYRLNGITSVPGIYLDGKTPAQIATIGLCLERFSRAGDWDLPAVKAELERICMEDPDLLSHTLWPMAEIDRVLHYLEIEGINLDPGAQIAASAQMHSVTQMGDLWHWPSGERLLCGDSRRPETYQILMGGFLADLLFADAPYGTAIAGVVSSKHGEFKDGSSLKEEEAQKLFDEFLSCSSSHIRDGALAYFFNDWKSLYPLLTAVRSTGLVQVALCTWDKQTASRGGLYKNQSEHIVVAKWGKSPATNNVKLGKYGRSRSTIWSSPGYGQFRHDRAEALANHPTVKPLDLLMDIFLDSTDIGQKILDPFIGSGSSMVAAHRLKRIVYGIEIDEKFCDVAIRRMHVQTGQYPIHLELGLSFEAVAKLRGVSLETPATPAQA